MRVPLQIQQTNGRQLAGQLSGPLRHFLATESGSALVLVAATAVALLWANSPWSAGYTATWETAASVQLGTLGLEMSIGHWISDGLMVLFFFVIGLEVRRDLAIGELTDRSRVVLPLLAGFAGMLVPALLFLLIAPSGEAAAGWGAVIGTDTAFLLGTLALVGPSISTQLRIFLLTLTVVDDIVAVSVIGVFYAHSIDLVAVGVALVGVVALVLLARFGVWRTWPYVLTTLLVWLATITSGVLR